MKKVTKAMTVALFSLTTALSYAQDDRNVEEYNLNEAGIGFVNGENLDAQGYDPVSVFPEGGEESLPGSEDISLTYEGVEYLFSSIENRDEFETNPSKYEPTYGGWCARAMMLGQQIVINTEYFTVVGNRSFFFVSKRAKRVFDRDVEANAALADAHWKEISGEDARL